MLAVLVLLSVTLITLVAVTMKWKYSYWQRLGFPYLEPQIPFGALDPVRRRQRAFGIAMYDCYLASKEKFVGIYLMSRPALLIRDAQLARDILSKDFASFHDRGIYVDEQRDPLSCSLFQLPGKTWKNLRVQLAPSFTSGKLKAMFPTIEDIADKMLKHLNKTLPEKGSATVEMKSVASSFAIDIIGSVIFGLEVNSFENPDNAFHRMRKEFTKTGFTDVIRQTTNFLYPSLEKLFNRYGWYQNPGLEMRKIVQETIDYRDKHNVSRKDMLQLLLQLRNTGVIDDNDSNWSAKVNSGDSTRHLSVDWITAQLVLFYVAGYDTTASTTAFTLYELSQYPDLLEKVKTEMDEALDKNGGLNYESLQDMRYLELCIMETIRKYPGLPILNRECTQEYTIPGTDKIIPKGTPIVIPLYGIHRDEEYFPNALGYDPERYLEENMAYNTAAYMPFGEGPRHCIAQRMGRLVTKIALVKIISNFDIIPRAERCELEMANYGVGIRAKGGINVSLAKKQKA